MNKIYLSNKKLNLRLLKRGAVWFDAGTPRSLFEASTFIEVVEKQTGVKIGCIEEASFNKGNINMLQMRKLIDTMPNCEYRSYLEDFLKNKITKNLSLVS